MRIPPRPVVQPALHQGDVQSDMQELALEACEAACEGDLAAVSGAFEVIGQAGVDGIHRYIDAGIPQHDAEGMAGTGDIGHIRNVCHFAAFASSMTAAACFSGTTS